MPDNRLDGATAPEVFPGLAFEVLRGLGGRGFRQNYRRAFHIFSPSKASVTKSRFRCASPDAHYLGQYAFECVAVILVAGEALRADNDAIGLGHDNGGLGAKFVFLVLLALADAADIRLMEAVNLVCVPALLVDGLAVAGKFFLPGGTAAFRQFARDIPQQGAGHGFDPTHGRCHFLFVPCALAEANDAQNFL